MAEPEGRNADQGAQCIGGDLADSRTGGRAGRIERATPGIAIR
ncbi:MAG TPA: hypothetical protein VFU97_11455 [Xanthobacteraceae bacterium]|nr:hypothetical protein [Xanthobacteraceae bacterium]